MERGMIIIALLIVIILLMFKPVRAIVGWVFVVVFAVIGCVVTGLVILGAL
jgi:hypothetical protein